MMISVTPGVALIVAQPGEDWQPAGTVTGASVCDACGVRDAAVADAIVRLQNSPNWRERDATARSLRRVDWKGHPDVVGALAFSAIRDRKGEVRREAIESLVRMGVCGPVVHETYARVLKTDLHLGARIWARQGLRSTARRCEVACSVCSSDTTIRVLPPETSEIEPSAGLPPVPSKEAEPYSKDLGTERSPSVELTPLPPSQTVPAPFRDSRVTPPVESTPAPPEPELSPLPPPADEVVPSGREGRPKAAPDRPDDDAEPGLNVPRAGVRTPAVVVPPRRRVALLPGLFRPWSPRMSGDRP